MRFISPYYISYIIYKYIYIYIHTYIHTYIWVVLQKLSHFKCMKFEKLTMNFFNFFDWDIKYNFPRHHFQYLAQFIAPRGGSGAIQIFSIHDYGTFPRHCLHDHGFSFIIASIAIGLPSPWSLFDYHFHRIDTQFTEEIPAHCIRMTGVVHLESIKCFFVYLE